MPSTYRVNFLFKGPLDGWSEGHIFQSPESDPGALAPAMKAIMSKRVLLLGKEYAGYGIRIRKVFDNAGNPVPRAVKPVIAPFPSSQAADNSGDPDFVAALTVATDAAGTHATRTYLGGIPDAVTTGGGNMDFNMPASLPFASAFTGWDAIIRGSLTNAGPITYGYFTRPRIQTTPIIGYVVGTDTRVTFTADAGAFAGLTVGATYTGGFSKLNGSKSLLNKVMLVTVVDDHTLKSAKQEAAGPFTGKGQVIVYNQLPTFIALASQELQLFAARHKRGRPFSRSRGRAPARPTV